MQSDGFTLIEIMFVLLITGILAAIAYPGYNRYITAAHRVDGKAALLDLASHMETYYSEHTTYLTATIATGKATDVAASTASPDQWYTLAITSKTADTYSLQATPIKAQGVRDTTCQTFILTHLGQKDIAPGPAGAPTGSIQDCW